MEEVISLLKQHAELIKYMYREGIVDNQFIEIQNFRTEENPDFFLIVDAVFRREQDQKMKNAASELQKEEPDYGRIHKIIENFRETSICMGTHGLVSTCNSFITCYEAKNFEGCVKCFKRLEDEYVLIKRRIDTLVQLEHLILAAGVIIPFMELPINNRKRAFNPK